MLRKTLFSFAVVALVSFWTTASAQEPTNQLTYFTFSAPFELPGGKTLPAGRYTFKIVDSPSNRHIVTIMSEDGKEVHATILAIPAQRQDPPDDPDVRFMETAANMPPAVKTWWYPGRTIGHEFIYPKDQARRLAAAQREAVLTVTTDATTTEQMQSAELTRIDATGKETAVTVRTERAGIEESAAAPVTREAAPAPAATATVTRETTTTRVETPAPPPPPAPTPSPAPTPPPAPTVTAPPEPAPTARPTEVETTRVEETRTELPRTATNLPLVGLIGLASLAGAALLRRRRQ